MSDKEVSGESGFIFVKALLVTLVMGLVVTGSYRLIKNRIDMMTLVRIQQRMDIVRDNVENAGRSFGAMIATGKAQPGSALDRCLNSKSCMHSPDWMEYKLHDALGRPLTGKLDLNGNPCSGARCPLTVTTTMKIECANSDPTCDQPSEVVSRYIVSKNENALTTRSFKPLEGEVYLSAFRCPDNEYVRAITSEGYLQCAPAEISPNEIACPDGTVSSGVNHEGFLVCHKMVNLCKKPISLAFVLDLSGSMANDKSLPFVEEGLSKFINRLDTTRDKASYSNFSAAASTPMTLTPVRAGWFDSFRGQNATGTTNMVAGLKAGGSTLEATSSAEKILILISDGFHNVGGGDPAWTAKLIKDTGVRVLTIAVTSKADITTLSRIASYRSDFLSASNAGNFDAALAKFAKTLCR